MVVVAWRHALTAFLQFFTLFSKVYREATELHLPKELDDLEVIMRDKIDQYAGSSKGDVGYQVKSSFRFFDRDARGVIDLVMFREALRKMGLKVDEMTAVALFARYDINRNGFVNYHEYIKNLLSKVRRNRARLALLRIELNVNAVVYSRNHIFLCELSHRTTSRRTTPPLWLAGSRTFWST